MRFSEFRQAMLSIESRTPFYLGLGFTLLRRPNVPVMKSFREGESASRLVWSPQRIHPTGPVFPGKNFRVCGSFWLNDQAAWVCRKEKLIFRNLRQPLVNVRDSAQSVEKRCILRKVHLLDSRYNIEEFGSWSARESVIRR